MEELIKILEDIANKNCDGHFVIYKFTTEWKVMACTPEVTVEERDCIRETPGFSTLEEALGDRIRAFMKGMLK